MSAPLPVHDQAALNFLLSRRSHGVRQLHAPVPDADQLRTILTAALRVPDHGKLEPWRMVVLEKPALERIAVAIGERGPAAGIDPEKVTKAVGNYAASPLAVLVIAAPRPSEKVPEIEQTLSAGALCLGVVNAATAAGFGATWLSGWPLADRVLLEQAFGVKPGEWAAGIIHIGTVTEAAPDRPRPDLDRVVTWVRA